MDINTLVNTYFQENIGALNIIEQLNLYFYHYSFTLIKFDVTAVYPV